MILDKFSLKGKVGIVTGASRGIGHGIAMGLAEAGADLALMGRVQETIEQAAKAVEGVGRKALAVVGDTAQEADVRRVVDETLKAFGRIDILVNAAGVTARAAAEDFPVAEWDRIMGVNLRGAFLMSVAAGREMIRQKSGKIIHIASMGTYVGIPNASAYVASKGGVGQYTKNLAVEWAKYNIQVNAIAPGYIETDMTRPLKQNRERMESIMLRTPAKRWGQPEELAGAAVFLASPASDFITGHILDVDGGFMAG
jgi:NAD(P)-dependent dehydrogenase (short-subunit alcohol dehydrogenase family)